ncbi:MAG TPA: ABC transporter ATP-binding protein [Firmicutes bacterium]|nr:ABC transporter ATP-binding protein [Bacillota bacterium]
MAASAAIATSKEGPEVMLELVGLRKYFSFGRRVVLKAVDDVSFTVRRGEVFGLVGESGCGKTTVGRTIVGLYKPTGGKIIFGGEDTSALRGAALKRFKRRVQMIFQDPYASLNPRMTVGDIIGEAIDIHGLASSRKERLERIHELLRVVGLNAEHAVRFPHEFSGGQRQRIGIARALAVDPEFLVADEPISALDVSVQAQIVNLLSRLQRERNLTYIFIAHDLSMVRHLSDNVGVMYLGHLVEKASSEDLYKNPLHPYTKGLLSAIPIPDPRLERERQRIILQGEVFSPINPPPGCRFRSRCKYAMKVCSEKEPVLKEVAPGHWLACYLEM